jgi:predicted solute-binding protein
VWAARDGIDVGGLSHHLSSARDAGRANLAAIAAAEAAAHGLTVPQCLSYLRDNLYYDLGSRERESLGLFRRYAAGHGLAPADTVIGWESRAGDVPLPGSVVR